MTRGAFFIPTQAREADNPQADHEPRPSTRARGIRPRARVLLAEVLDRLVRYRIQVLSFSSLFRGARCAHTPLARRSDDRRDRACLPPNRRSVSRGRCRSGGCSRDG